MKKLILSTVILLMSITAQAEFREIWGRYFLANNIKGGFDLITNLDTTLDVRNTNESYWTLRSLFFFQLGKGWFLDVGPAVRLDFASNYKYQEIRIIGSVHYIKTFEDFLFRNRLRLENRWIKEGPKGQMVESDPFRVRLRVLIQKNHLFAIHEKMFAYAGPEFFFEQNIKRDKKIDLGSIRWIFSVGIVLTETLSMEIDYWHRQYVNQEDPNFGSLIFRTDVVF